MEGNKQTTNVKIQPNPANLKSLEIQGNTMNISNVNKSNNNNTNNTNNNTNVKRIPTGLKQATLTKVQQ